MTDREQLSTTTRWVALGAILTLAIALRSFRLAWGLPQHTFLDSVLFYVTPARRLLREGVWRPVSFVHPPATGSALAVVTLAWAALTGTSATTFGIPQVELVGRVMTVFFSTASIVALYVLARRLVGSRAALLAAAAFALSPVHMIEAHRTNSDAPMLLLSLLAAHQATTARDSASVRRLAVAFALAGAAAAVKYTGLAAVTVPAWIALTWRDATFGRRVQLLAMGGGIALLVLLVGISPLLGRWDHLVVTTRKLRLVGMSFGQPGHDLRGQGWIYTRYVYALVAALPYVLGWAVYVTACVGLWLLRTAPRARGPVLAALLPFFLVQGAAETVVPRYYLPMAPYLCLAAGLALDRLWQRRGALGAAVAATLLAYTLLLTGSQCLRIPGPSNPVGEALRREIDRANASGRALVLGYDSELRTAYDPLSSSFSDRRKVRVVALPSRPARAAHGLDRYRAWLEREQIDAVLVTGWRLGVARREGRAAELDFIAALGDGSLGFRQAAVSRSGYFSEQLYTWADPSFATELGAGILDHELYVR